MNISNNKIKLILCILSLAATFTVITYSVLYGQLIWSLFFLTIFLLLMTYPFTDAYNIKNDLKKMVQRSGKVLLLTPISYFNFYRELSSKQVEISRITTVTISKNNISLVLNGNGQALDIQLLGTKEDIYNRFCELITSDERRKMNIKVL